MIDEMNIKIASALILAWDGVVSKIPLNGILVHATALSFSVQYWLGNWEGLKVGACKVRVEYEELCRCTVAFLVIAYSDFEQGMLKRDSKAILL
jgi:hypothetical protein